MPTKSENQPLRIGMLAGEISGDNLGADLIRQLRVSHSKLIVEGVGGTQMIAEGCRSMVDINRLAMMGYVEPLLHLPTLLSIRRSLYRHFVADPPAVFLGIDYAYFNNSLERKLKAAGIKTAHYVSPQLWASRPSRIRALAKTVDLMLCLFPFEVDLYHRHGIEAVFVGHPLATRFPLESDAHAARQALNLPVDKKVVALLPGSRSNEVKHLLGPFLDAAKWCLQRDDSIEFILPAANSKRYDEIEKQISQLNLPLRLILGQSHQAMAAADVVMMASGTTTLEAMLLKKPMVVAYKMSALNYAIMSRLLISEHISLPNILAGQALVPEILQDQVSGESLGSAVMAYFEEPNRVTELKQQFQHIHQSLINNQSQGAAEAILALAHS